MLSQSIFALNVWLFAGAIGTAVIACGLYNKYAHGINTIPGPFLAAYTDYWRFFLVWGRRPELTHIKLHEKYGDFVRIGPKTVLVADWDATKKIYALNAGYVKVSDCVRNTLNTVNRLTHRQSLVSTRSNRTLPKENRFSASSIRRTRSSIANFVVRLQTHIP
jgi:hypothetical protein